MLWLLLRLLLWLLLRRLLHLQLRQLAERRRRKVGGDAWIGCDGPLEACWTEALAASISTLTAKAVAAELAGSSKVAVRILIETDALGRMVQVNKVCCGGAANAGGAGPGGDQFAAASVPAVPCVCTLLADQTAATSSG